MDTQEQKPEGEGCGKGKCCGGKMLAVIGLLAIGGIGGFFAARHCSGKACPFKVCPVSSAPAAATPAPATPRK